MSNGILTTISEKDKLYESLNQTDTNNTVLYEILRTGFKEYRVGLRKITRKAKRDFYIHIYITDIKTTLKTWSLINETLYGNIRKQDTKMLIVLCTLFININIIPFR